MYDKVGESGMRYAIIDDNRKITNIIEVEPEFADDFEAHYLGDEKLGIGDVYPAKDFPIPGVISEPTLEEQLADLQNQILTMRLGGY